MLFSAGRSRSELFFLPRLHAFLLASPAVLSPSELCTIHRGPPSGPGSDPTGAVIPGASLTLTNANSGVALKTEAGKGGDYTFLPCPQGNTNAGRSSGLPGSGRRRYHCPLNATVSYDVRMTVAHCAIGRVDVIGSLVDTTSTQLDESWIRGP